MVDRTFGHFVRVLVDVDISQQLRYKVLVERKDFAFFVDLEYKNLPACKLLNRRTEFHVAKKLTKEVKREYNIINDGRKKQGSLANDPIVVEDVAGTSMKGPTTDTYVNSQVEKEANHNKSHILRCWYKKIDLRFRFKMKWKPLKRKILSLKLKLMLL